jgi:multidrug efflux system outer membrane protein
MTIHTACDIRSPEVMLRIAAQWRLRRRVVILMATAAMIVSLAGCRVGPDFCRPPISSIRDHYSEPTTSDTVTEEDLSRWWDHIHDPRLNQLIAELSQENLELHESYFRIVEARALAGAVKGRFLPTLDQKDSYTHRKNSINGTQFGNPLSTPFNLYSVGFDSAWEIDLFGKIQRSLESATAKAQATREAYAHLRLTLLAELATNYVNYRVVQERIRIAERNLETQTQTLGIVSNRLENGLVGALDQAQAESNMYLTSATIPASRQELVHVRNRICILVGNVPGTDMDEFLGTGPIPTVPDWLGIGVPCDLLRRRPDVRQAEWTVASACADIGVAMADLYPQLTLRGDISVDSRQYTNLFNSNSLAFSVGPSLRWKLLYWGSIRQNIESRKAASEQAIARYQQTVLRAIEEVENSLVSYHNQADREKILKRAVDATARSVQLSESRYDNGLISFQPVLDSQRELLKSEAELVETRGAMAISLIQTYKAAGGGWGVSPARKPRDSVLAEIAECTRNESMTSEDCSPIEELTGSAALSESD